MNRGWAMGFKASIFSLAFAAGGVALAAPASHSTVAAARPAHSEQTLPMALRPVLYQTLAKDAGSVYAINRQGCATVSRQKLTACFGSDGAHFSGAGSLGLHLLAFGRGKVLTSVKAVPPLIQANQVTYDHGNLSEWWRVLPVGFEQGFTIAKKPAGNGELVVALAARPPEAGAPIVRWPGADPGPVKKSIPIVGRDTKSGLDTGLRRYDDGITAFAGMTKKGNTTAWGKLHYGQLVVTDATGRVIPATLRVVQDHEQARSYPGGERILIAVNDAHAAYPLTVDPLVWLEQKVAASDGEAGDWFGWSVAVADTTALIGAPQVVSDGQGAAYVFTNSGGTWTQTAELTANDGAEGDRFGTSVAVNGTTAFIGAPYAAINGNVLQGAVYVFSESGGTWSQVAKLTASDNVARALFGWSVALDGATALVGAPDTNRNGNTQQGAAYVFSESGGSWTQTAELAASDGIANDQFGHSVALDGATALIGVPQVASGGPGAAYVFDESGGNWTQTQKLTASDGAASDQFGSSVTLGGATVLVGAPQASINGNGGQGAVYVFDDSGGDWTQTQKLTASDGAASDQFGSSVALDGPTALIGAIQCDLFGNCHGPGAAYVFDGSGGSWAQEQKLTPSDGASGNWFGYAAALDDATALIGTPFVDGNDDGAAYFESNLDLDLLTVAPDTVPRYGNYLVQAIATNDASASAPIAVTVAVPAAASYVSATSTQGSCGESSGTVTCNFGSVGSGGFAVASVTLEATGNGGSTIDNTASVAKATPKLSGAAPTLIRACPAGYVEYDGTLAPAARYRTPPYQSAAGTQTVLFNAPLNYTLRVGYQADPQSTWTIRRVSRHALYHYGPAGAYRWQINAGSDGGAFTLCVLHP